MLKIEHLDVRLDVEGEGDEAVFAKLFDKYIRLSLCGSIPPNTNYRKEILLLRFQFLGWSRRRSNTSAAPAKN